MLLRIQRQTICFEGNRVPPQRRANPTTLRIAEYRADRQRKSATSTTRTHCLRALSHPILALRSIPRITQLKLQTQRLNILRLPPIPASAPALQDPRQRELPLSINRLQGLLGLPLILSLHVARIRIDQQGSNMLTPRLNVHAARHLTNQEPGLIRNQRDVRDHLNTVVEHRPRKLQRIRVPHKIRQLTRINQHFPAGKRAAANLFQDFAGINQRKLRRTHHRIVSHLGREVMKSGASARARL